MGDFWWWLALVPAFAFAAFCWVNFIRPRHRHWGLRRPVHAHFTIRDSGQSISGRDVSKGDPHRVRKLTLPSNRIKEIEIGLVPKFPIYVAQIVLGFGQSNDAPVVQKRIFQYVESGARPSTENDYTDVNGSYHARLDRRYNVGTHYVIGFRVRTRRVGRYPVSLALITDEVEGNYEGLEILVEDRPSTPMLCHAKDHGRNCLVRAVSVRKSSRKKK